MRPTPPEGSLMNCLRKKTCLEQTTSVSTAPSPVEAGLGLVRQTHCQGLC